MDRLGKSVQIPHMAEHIGLLDDDTGRVLANQVEHTLLADLVAVDVHARGDNFDVARRDIGLNDLAPLRVETARQHDPFTACQPLGHEHGLADG